MHPSIAFDIKPGDVVIDLALIADVPDSSIRLTEAHLKTVGEIQGDKAICDWFIDGSLHRESLPIDRLVPVGMANGRAYLLPQ